ncbi:MAG: TenA family protein [Spirulinaceae cyanobacterium RM2_2_10]|nr:TenA family protein [Spirulinaceae cyanobacterium SM2_1_0]NJO19226.1 TenA family protein [Spirulinaceae cyanobacterium RM2_2_10]
MTIRQQLWQTHQDLAQACLVHPFVQGLASGELSRAKFAFYVGQDAFFLQAFARAYSIAAAKVADWQGFVQLHELAAGVLAELKLHQHYAAQWEVDLSAIAPAPATRCYTDFLLATAWGQDPGLTVVAMCPCLRLYAFLGQQLAANGLPKHSYTDWIATYSSGEFEQLAQTLEDLVDRYASDTPTVHATYRYALTCEHSFFEAAWRVVVA